MPVAPLRALITGFGPFPGIIDNASEAFAPLLAHRAAEQLAHLQASAAILPTEWDAAPRILRRLFEELQPHICLHLGVVGGARELILETIARNSASAKPDAIGALPSGKVLLDGAPYYLMPSVATVRMINRARHRGLPVSASIQPGDYICNALFFHSLMAARGLNKSGVTRRLVAFVHLPVRVGGAGLAEDSSLNDHNLPIEGAVAGALAILAAMADQMRALSPGFGMGFATAD